MMQRGLLPNITGLIESGCSGELQSVFPPVTAPAWSSIYTGTNPGKHGIYDFMRRLPGSYRTAPVDTTYRDGQSLFRIVSEAGGQVFAINAPLSFPPEELNGAMIPGLPTPFFSIAPAELEETFLEHLPGYEPFPESIRQLSGNTHSLYETAPQYCAQTANAFEFLNSRFPEWRLAFVHFQITDMAMHFAWGDQPLLDAVHQSVDKALGDILSTIPGDTTILLISDHGHGELTSYLHLNSWLNANGYLHFKRSPLSFLKTLAFKAGLTPARIYQLLFKIRLGGQVRRTMHNRSGLVLRLLQLLFVSMDDVDWSRTRAYALGNVGQVYMNVEGREPNGIIAPGPELERETSELQSRLSQLEDPRTGEPIAEKVVRGADLFSGDRADEAPDLLLVPRDFACWNFAQAQFTSSNWIEKPHDGRNGHHRMNGIVCASGRSAARGTNLAGSILDVTPTVLALLGLPLPGYLDGRVLSEAFDLELDEAKLPDDETTFERGSRDGYTRDEEALVAERLDALGYL
jgi:predicted AlkP superfamily phosphohydrolase/phosphomutase